MLLLCGLAKQPSELTYSRPPRLYRSAAEPFREAGSTCSNHQSRVESKTFYSLLTQSDKCWMKNFTPAILPAAGTRTSKFHQARFQSWQFERVTTLGTSLT